MFCALSFIFFIILFIGDLSLRSSLPFCLIVDRVLPERIFVKYLFIAPTFGDIDISLSFRITSISLFRYPA